MRAAGPGNLSRGLQRMFTGAFGRLGGGDLARFPHGIHQGGQIVTAWRPGLPREIQPDHFPPQRNGEPGGVRAAQIVTMGFGVGGQWPQHGGGVGIDVRQGGDSRLSAR